MERDWKAAPEYSYIERDVTSKHGGNKTVKTYRVLMIEGSHYNQLTAINDQPLTGAQERQEQEKLNREMQTRKRETPREREHRVSKYEKERRQDHAMIEEMAHAFDFRLEGSDAVRGHDCWLLAATPKPGYQTKLRDARILTGMRGKLWVDKEHYQWVKVEGEVTRPVAFYGVFAKVGPGTRFTLEQAPVSGDLWLPTQFSMKVNATALGFLNENSTDDESYKDYQPMKGTVGKTGAVASNTHRD